MNVKELCVNELVQNIDILSECGHYDHQKYPWHAKMVDLQCATLLKLLDGLTTEMRIELIIGMSCLPVEPVLQVLNECMEGVTHEQFALHTWRMLHMDDDFCTRLAEQGPRRLLDGESLCIMVLHYLHKSNIPISAKTVRKQLESITKNVLKDANEVCDWNVPKQVGLTQIKHSRKFTMTRVMKLRSISQVSY